MKKSFKFQLKKTAISTSIVATLFLSFACSKDSKRKRSKSGKNKGAITTTTNTNSNFPGNRNTINHSSTASVYVSENARDNSRIQITHHRVGNKSYDYLLNSPNCLKTNVALNNLSKYDFCQVLQDENIHQNCSARERQTFYRRFCMEFAKESWSCKGKLGKVKTASNHDHEYEEEIDLVNVGAMTKKLIKKDGFTSTFQSDTGMVGFKFYPNKKKKQKKFDINVQGNENEIYIAYKNEKIDSNVRCNFIDNKTKISCNGLFKSGGVTEKINHQTWETNLLSETFKIKLAENHKFYEINLTSKMSRNSNSPSLIIEVVNVDENKTEAIAKTSLGEIELFVNAGKIQSENFCEQHR